MSWSQCVGAKRFGANIAGVKMLGPMCWDETTWGQYGWGQNVGAKCRRAKVLGLNVMISK